VNLTPTRLEHTYEAGDESGYRFTVVAERGAGGSWTATVTMETDGYITAEDAVRGLGDTAEEFVRQVKEKS
jgi:hypothetical protein